MSQRPPGSLLARRLVIVSGKGGTGKTTVTAALAVAAAAAGRRVLVVEVGRDEHLPSLLDPGSQPAGYAGRSLRPGIRSMRVDPFSALAEYLGLQLGVRAIAKRVLASRAFQQLMSAAPGWRELITLGKVWHLEQQEREPGQPLYDLIAVDAPATGHGVSFLDVPRVVASAVRAGPLRRNARNVEEMIEDPDRTLLLPVALAEELPVRETAELVRRAREQVGIAVDRVVANGVMSAPFPPDLAELDERLAALRRDVPLGRLPNPAVLAACARHLRARFELNRGYVAELARCTGLPVVELPYLTGGIDAPGAVEQLGAALLQPLGERAA